ncbi:hypothetical protein [Methylomonas methanica]|uniref:Fibronectin type-III domain-containing protein n=1 Tax=Methylomonas methanica (strain DSM 25384 / MC09) TaxID=857087 RepID=G0A4J6_METMM|nr:hypothetical protein [Methylomonas methanica]AEG01587.1 hypothetical protein Metme_3213 [Methylomonas methanica MC09]
MTSLFHRHFSFFSTASGILLLALQFPGLAQAQQQAPRLFSDTQTATAGYYRLNWESADIDPVVELQQADNPAFTDADIRYRGHDGASVVSGMPDGEWYYRARSITGGKVSPWSDTIAVKVAHHPLSRAWLFFGLGTLVFAATLLLIIRGTEQNR